MTSESSILWLMSATGQNILLTAGTLLSFLLWAVTWKRFKSWWSISLRIYITVLLTASTAWPGAGESDYHILSWISMFLEEDQPGHFLYWVLIPFRNENGEFEYLAFALGSVTAYWIALMLLVTSYFALYRLFDDSDDGDTEGND